MAVCIVIKTLGRLVLLNKGSLWKKALALDQGTSFPSLPQTRIVKIVFNVRWIALEHRPDLLLHFVGREIGLETRNHTSEIAGAIAMAPRPRTQLSSMHDRSGFRLYLNPQASSSMVKNSKRT